MMTATYSPDDNKLRLYASSRLSADEYARVKAAGFKWAPKQQLFVAPMWTPDREDLLIEWCGEVGDEDTSLTERAEERAERFDGYQQHRRRDAEAAHRAVSAIADNIPLGQPILVGHHSERHARRDAEKIENGMRRAVKMWRTADYWRGRAAGAIRHAKYKELPAVRARRIKTIEADRRRTERNRQKAADCIRLWSTLNAQGADGRPCDDALRQKRALHIANVSGVYLRSDDPRGYCVWSALDKGTMTAREAQLLCLKTHARTIASCLRWLEHFDHRLTYEKAMLDEQGAADLIAPRPPQKSAKAQLPLCNYRAPEGLKVENPYHRGELLHYPQIEMTQAEWARIPTDYKGTRAVDHSHRVRTTMQRRALVCVFLTDAKIHERPAPAEAPRRELPAVPVPVRTPIVPEAIDPLRERMTAIQATLRAGVQVVSAPQLFPTPADVARQVIDLADLDAPGLTILEPSAGTGALLAALPTMPDARITAVEISPRLAEQLRQRFPAVTVHAADFLTWTTDQTFDRIVMNPPFVNADDIRHIQRARALLAPGGILVALCANGPRQQEKLQPLADEWIDLPAGTFTGTNVRAAILVIRDNAIRQFAEAIDAEAGQLAEVPFSLTAKANSSSNTAQIDLFGAEE